MKIIPNRHEDDRRVLVEWNKDIPMARCKTIYAKGKCTLGKHYHLKNDSIFFIVKGRALCVLQDLKGRILKRQWLFEGDTIFVPTEVVHTLTLLPETIMNETASLPYDSQDEIPFTQ